MNTERASALLTDLYQVNIIQADLDHGETKTAVFQFFVRTLPARRGFLVAAGLEQALDYLENLPFAASRAETLRVSPRSCAKRPAGPAGGRTSCGRGLGDARRLAREPQSISLSWCPFLRRCYSKAKLGIRGISAAPDAAVRRGHAQSHSSPLFAHPYN